MARVSLNPRMTLHARAVRWYARRRFGEQLEPWQAISHNGRVLRTFIGLERSALRWNRLDPHLETLAVMASAHALGCAWCTDFGYWFARSEGTPAEVLSDVPRWRESVRFDDLERSVLAYAEGMTVDPAGIDDALVAGLRERLGEPGLVELTMVVAHENLRSRFNTAMGLASQGFRDRCDLAAA